jgi:hypothetical protein
VASPSLMVRLLLLDPPLVGASTPSQMEEMGRILPSGPSFAYDYTARHATVRRPWWRRLWPR